MTSQINPNNIDGNYPVAGQPNNTQGFRDNFTNIKQNFQYAENEIDDLQNKVVLKQALSGGTLNNNMNDNLMYAVKFQDVSWTYVQNATTSGTVPLDFSAGQYQYVTTTGPITLSFANWPISGTAGLLQVAVNITSTAHTLTLPSSVSLGTVGIQGYSSNVITFAQTGTYQFAFSSVDGGTTITVYDLNRPLSYYTNTVTIANTAVSTGTSSGALIVSGGVGVAGNLYVGGNIVGSIVATGNTFAGNTTVGNLLTAGFVSATGNIDGGNLRTAGLVSATGNVSGGNLNATGLSLTGNVLSALNVTGNITGGNIAAVAIVSAAGNVTGGNLRTGGLVSATGTVTSVSNIIGGNIQTSGQLSATGNAMILTGTAPPAGGTAGAGLRMSSTSNLGIFFGSGVPTLAAAQGSLYLNTSGSSTSTRLYVNTNGSTGWTSVTTAT
jgi:hypothetical protein